MDRSATFVDTIRGNLGRAVSEALPDKGLGKVQQKLTKAKNVAPLLVRGVSGM